MSGKLTGGDWEARANEYWARWHNSARVAGDEQFAKEKAQRDNARLRAWMEWLATEYEGDQVTMAALIGGALIGDPAPTTRASKGPGDE